MRPPLPRRAAVAIVVLALAVRLAAGAWWQSQLRADQRFFFGDSATYWALGQRIAQGQSYEYEPADARVFRTPGYPLLLAAMFTLVGSNPPVMYARALSAVLGALAVALIIGWAGWLFDPRAGLIAGAITALYPGAIAMGAFVLSEAAFCPLMIAQLWLWGLADRCQAQNKRWLLAGSAGVAAGLATLARPSWLLFTPFAWLLAMLFAHAPKRQLVSGLVALTLMAAVLSPWWIRNAWVVGHFVPTTLQVGASLYDGLNPQATGASDMRRGDELARQMQVERDLQMKQDRAMVMQDDGTLRAAPDEDSLEYRRDRLLAREALTWARANPGRVVALAVVKLGRLWNVWPNEPQLRSWPLRLAVLCSYLPIGLAALWGAWKFTRAGWPYALAWMPAVYLTLLHTVFVSSIRYREPAMLALIVLAAGALGSCCRGAKPTVSTIAA